MKLESTKLLLLQIIQVNAYYYFLMKIVPVIPVPKLYKRRAKYQTLQNKNRPMLTSVLNICPDKTKGFVHRDIRTKKLLCLVKKPQGMFLCANCMFQCSKIIFIFCSM